MIELRKRIGQLYNEIKILEVAEDELLELNGQTTLQYLIDGKIELHDKLAKQLTELEGKEWDW